MMVLQIAVITHFLACLGACLLGFSPLFVRVSDLGPMTIGFYRMLLAMPFLAIWMHLETKGTMKTKIRPKDYAALVSAGVIFGVDLALWNWSIDYTSIVNATLLNNAAAIYVPLILFFVFREYQPKKMIMASLCGFVGCCFLVGDSFTVSMDNLLGDVMALLSGVTVAIYIIVVKRVRERLTAGRLMFWISLPCIVTLGIIGALFGESFWPMTGRDTISVFGQAIVVHVIGQGLVAYSMGRIPAAYGALIMFLAPVTAAILGWIFYQESLNLIQGASILVILFSILAVRGRPRKKY